jgi:hypothetical protein
MYSTLDMAYNDNSEDLDKMARELNNKKNNLFKSVHDDFEKKQSKWENDIIEYNNSYKNPYGYFNAHPKSDSSKSISIDSNSMESNSSNHNLIDDNTDYDSISIDSPSLDSYIDTIKDKDKEKGREYKKKPIHNFIKSLSHNKKKSNEEDIFSHIKYCFECREQLLRYMKNHEKIDSKSNIISDKNNKNKINNESLFSYFGTIQIKEIFLIIILGIILIIFLDFLMKTPYSIR